MLLWQDVGGFTPILEAAYHGHELLLKYLLARGADIDVEGVSLGTQSGNARSQNGPFSTLEWATRQGHRRCAEILAHASSAPARADARLRKEVEKCVSGMIDMVAKGERQHEREQNRDQKEVAEVIRRMVQEIERRARGELRKQNEARRKQREEEQKSRVIVKCLDDVIKHIVREHDRMLRAAKRRAEQQHAGERRARNDVAFCIEGIIRMVEKDEVAAKRGAAQCIERLVRILERREQSTRLRECRGCLSALVRRVILEVDPDQVMPIRTYLQLRGLGAWAAHLIGFLQIRNSVQARQVTAEDLRRLGKDFLHVPIPEESIAIVLERLSMPIDPEVEASKSATTQAWTRTANDEARKRRQEQEKAEKEAAAMRVTQNLIELLSTAESGESTSGGGPGYIAVHEIDASKLNARDLELTGLSELASDDWRAAAAIFGSSAIPVETVQEQEQGATAPTTDNDEVATKSHTPARQLPAIVGKLRRFCEKLPCNGQLRVVKGSGAKSTPNGDSIHMLPPYATETLQIEPPPTTGRPKGVFHVGASSIPRIPKAHRCCYFESVTLVAACSTFGRDTRMHMYAR